MEILNMVIPVLMRFYSLVSNWSIGSRIKPNKVVHHPTKYDVIIDVKLFPTDSISQDILSQFFDIIQPDDILQKQVPADFSHEIPSLIFPENQARLSTNFVT